jgi:hypothetical protein
MKKTIAFLLLALSALSVPPLSGGASAYAETPAYARILKDNVYLYKNSSLLEADIVCELYRTYYVVVLGESGGAYEVEYFGEADGYTTLTGWASKEELTAWADPTLPLFPNIDAMASDNILLYKSAAKSSAANGTVLEGQSVKCYGRVYNAAEGGYYFLVKIGAARIGYLQAEYLNVTYPEPHPDPLPAPPTASPEPPASLTPAPNATPPAAGCAFLDGGENDTLLQIVLIAAICVPALLIVYLLFRPSKRGKRKYKNYNYYDDD